MFNFKQTKNPNTSLQTFLVETPWSAADYYKEYYLKIQENVSNSTWRECPGVWSGSCSGREPSTWSATTSSTWKAEEVTIGMKKSTDARKKLRPSQTCQSVLQEGEGLWRRTDTKRMVPSLSAPTWKNSNCCLPWNSIQYIAIAEQTEELFWLNPSKVVHEWINN